MKTNINKNNFLLSEDAAELASKFTDEASIKKLRARSIELERVLQQLNNAVVTAENKNEIEIADKLKLRAEKIQELLDGAKVSIDTLSDEGQPQNQTAVGGADSDEEDSNEESDTEAETEQKTNGEGTNPDSDQPTSDSENSDSSSEEASNEAEGETASSNSDNETTNNSKKLDSTDAGSQDSEASQSDSSQDNSNTSDTAENDSQDTETNSSNSSSADKTSNDNSTSSTEQNDQDSAPNNTASSDSASESDEDEDFDPFAKPDANMGQLGNQKQKQVTKQEMINKIKEKLAALEGDARQGALDGLKKVLSDRGVVQESFSLKESFKNKTLIEMSDDDFADLINDTLEQIDKVSKVNYSKDIEERRKKIMQDINDQRKTKELQQEDNIELQKDFVKKKAKEKEANKYSSYKTINDFKINFYNTINNQVDFIKREKQTYSVINARYEGEDALKKGIKTHRELDETIPVIDFYFDMSGSWTDNAKAMEIGKQAVATVKEFEDRGEIKLNIFYFSSIVTPDSTDYRLGGGTGAWSEILQNIKATEAKNVVLMTDGDMACDADSSGLTCKVDGCVWLIWCLDDYATGSKAIASHLIGKEGTKQYSFGSGGRMQCS